MVKINKNDNLDVLKEFIDISNQRRFDFYESEVKFLRNYNLDNFKNLTIHKQLIELKNIIGVFNRNIGYKRISKTKLFSYNIKFQYDSFTGLYSKVI